MTIYWSLSNTGQELLATSALNLVCANRFSGILKSELSKIKHSSQIKKLIILVPSARQIKEWKPKSPEMRAQLVDISSGRPQQDFIVENFHKLTNILNALPLGRASAILFGRKLAINHFLTFL